MNNKLYNKLHVGIQLAGFVESLDKMASEDFSPLFRTHYRDLDEMTGGLETGITVIAGRPSMGKSDFALNIALNAVFLENKKCIYFSLESNGQAVVKRIASIVTLLDTFKFQHAYLNEKNWPTVISCVSVIDDLNFYIDDSVFTIQQIESYFTDSQDEKPGLIVVDSLQMFENHRAEETRYQNLNEIILALKRIAFKNDCPVILTSHLHKQLEQRADKRPLLCDFAETEMMVNAADKVLFLYRDDVYYENTPNRGTVEVICAKNKTGSVGRVRLMYDYYKGIFTDFKRKEAPCTEKELTQE